MSSLPANTAPYGCRSSMDIPDQLSGRNGLREAVKPAHHIRCTHRSQSEWQSDQPPGRSTARQLLMRTISHQIIQGAVSRYSSRVDAGFRSPRHGAVATLPRHATESTCDPCNRICFGHITHMRQMHPICVSELVRVMIVGNTQGDGVGVGADFYCFATRLASGPHGYTLSHYSNTIRHFAAKGMGLASAVCSLATIHRTPCTSSPTFRRNFTGSAVGQVAAPRNSRLGQSHIHATH
jgi:hypothetical protein